MLHLRLNHFKLKISIWKIGQARLLDYHVQMLASGNPYMTVVAKSYGRLALPCALKRFPSLLETMVAIEVLFACAGAALS